MKKQYKSPVSKKVAVRLQTPINGDIDFGQGSTQNPDAKSSGGLFESDGNNNPQSDDWDE